MAARQPGARLLPQAGRSPRCLLAQRIANVQRSIEEKAGGLLDERDRLIQQGLWLQNELENAGTGG